MHGGPELAQPDSYVVNRGAKQEEDTHLARRLLGTPTVAMDIARIG